MTPLPVTVRALVLSFAAVLQLVSVPVSAAGPGAAGSGAISGRIVNETSGAVLERARVTLDGTLIEAFADSAGRYLLAPVAPGPATVRIFYTGLAPASRRLDVAAGATAEVDFVSQWISGNLRNLTLSKPSGWESNRGVSLRVIKDLWKAEGIDIGQRKFGFNKEFLAKARLLGFEVEEGKPGRSEERIKFAELIEDVVEV